MLYGRQYYGCAFTYVYVYVYMWRKNILSLTRYIAHPPTAVLTAAAAAAAAARWNRERRSAFSVCHRLRAFKIYKLRLVGNNFLRLLELDFFLIRKTPIDCNIYSKRIGHG